MYQSIAIVGIWFGVGLCSKNNDIGIVAFWAMIATVFVCMTLPLGG